MWRALYSQMSFQKMLFDCVVNPSLEEKRRSFLYRWALASDISLCLRQPTGPGWTPPMLPYGLPPLVSPHKTMLRSLGLVCSILFS